MRIDFSRPIIQWATLITLALTWGSSFILMKKGLLYFSPDEVAAFRIFVASTVLLPIALPQLRLVRKHFWPLLVTGLFGNALPAFLFALAQTEIPSSLSGMLNSLTSLFTLTIGLLLFKTRTTVLQVLGVLVALIGALGLIGYENLQHLNVQFQYSLLAILAASMYGLAVNTIKAKLQDLKPTHITALSFLLTGPVSGIYLFAGTDFTTDLTGGHEVWLGVFYLSILAIVGTAIAVIVFNRLIKETTAVFASSVTYMIPVVALGWGVLDGEEIGLDKGLFLILILIGILLINSINPNSLFRRLFR